jgi:pimeloyl-ACP methyl ester carboxylesterase
VGNALYRSETAEAEVRAWCRARLERWDRPLDQRTVTTGAGDTHLVSTGTGDRTLVLVPGTNLCGATSTTLVDRLTDRARVVAIDLPGQPGLSAAARPRDRMRVYGSMLDEVVAGLEADRVTLVGHSMGAAVVLAATPSPRIAAIALVDPAGFTKPAVGMSLMGAFVAWTLRPRPSTSARLIERMQADGRRAGDELTEWFSLVGHACRSSGAPGPSEADVVGRWRDTPRAVIVGEQDVFFPPERLRPVVEERLGVTPVVVAGAGHLLPVEDPSAAADAILAVG